MMKEMDRNNRKKIDRFDGPYGGRENRIVRRTGKAP